MPEKASFHLRLHLPSGQGPIVTFTLCLPSDRPPPPGGLCPPHPTPPPRDTAANPQALLTSSQREDGEEGSLHFGGGVEYWRG